MDISLQFPTAKASCLTPHHGVIFYNFAGRARPIAIRFRKSGGEEGRDNDDEEVALKGCPIPVLSATSFQTYCNNNSGNDGGDAGSCATSTLTSSILQNVFDYHLHRLSSKSSEEDGKVVDGGGEGRQFVDQLQCQTSLLATMECQDCRPPPSPTAASVRRQHTSPHRQHQDGCSATVSLFRPFADQEKLGHMATLDELNAFVSRKLGTTREISQSSENKQKEVDAIALIEAACATRSKAALRKGVVSKGAHYNNPLTTTESGGVEPVEGGNDNNANSGNSTTSNTTTTVESLMYSTSPFSYCRADEIAFHTSVTPSSTDGANSLSNAVHIRGHYIPMSVFDAAHLYKYCVLARSYERSQQHQQHTSAHNATSAQQYFVHNEAEPSTPLQALQCAYSFATRKLCPIEIHIDSLSGTRLWTGGEESSSSTRTKGVRCPSSSGTTKLVRKTSSSAALLPISHPPPSIPVASSKTRRVTSSSRPSSTSQQRLRHHPLLAALSIGRVVDHIDFTLLQAEPNERLRIENEQGKCLEIIFFEFSKSAHNIISNERTIRAITGLQGSRYKRRFYKDFTTITQAPVPSTSGGTDSENQSPTTATTGDATQAATVVVAPTATKVPTATTANGLISALSFGARRKTPKRQPTPQELRERHHQRQLKAKTHTL